jgi:hypothetical protein
MGDPAQVEALLVETQVVGVEAAGGVDVADAQVRDDLRRVHTVS